MLHFIPIVTVLCLTVISLRNSFIPSINLGGFPMKLLIIEDEILLAHSLKALLEHKGYEVDCAYDGEDGYNLAEEDIYDLLILDVMMPKMNGYEVVKKLRAKHLGTPILMLTTKSELEDELDGLNAGADYYLTKPFDSRKLLACIKALLRRQGTQIDELVVGNTSLSLSTAILSCHEKTIQLSAKEFDVLRYLMSSPRQIHPKEAILERVWGYSTNAVENHVEVYIGMLRKKLKHIHSDMGIKALRRLGYVLEVKGS